MDEVKKNMHNNRVQFLDNYHVVLKHTPQYITYKEVDGKVSTVFSTHHHHQARNTTSIIQEIALPQEEQLQALRNNFRTSIHQLFDIQE